jgi:hypothetical protein
MTPSFPVAGLMLAAACVAAPGVDMLGNILLCCDFSVRRKVKYRAVWSSGANEGSVYAGFSGNARFVFSPFNVKVAFGYRMVF